MGKRRKEGPQADKYNPHAMSDEEDEEEIENNLEKEPLKPEEIANIKARKKLIATRRIPAATVVNGSSTVTSSFAFTPFSPFNPSVTNADTENKPSVFSGFKGFLSKPSTNTTTSSTSTITLTTLNGAPSEVAPRPTLTISEPPKSTPPTTNLFGASKESSLFKPNESNSSAIFGSLKPTETTTTTTPKQIDTSSAAATNNNNLNHSNINDKDLSFMNDLNDLYERYYGSIKEKNFTIPSDILNGSDLAFDQESSQDGKKEDEDDESKKKYAYLLADLNKHCSKWISKHVEENPLVILTPVFVDYFAYLILLEKNFFPNTFKKEKPVNGISSTTTNTTTSNTTASLFKFASSTANGPEQTTTTTPAFSLPTSTSTKNGIDSDNHKHLNGGFKFGSLASTTPKETVSLTTPQVNGSKKQEEAHKETEELKEEDQKNLEQSSKTFASLINKTPFSQIPLASANSTTTSTPSFLFKPAEVVTDKKDSTDSKKETPSTTFSSITQESPSLFKFTTTPTTTTTATTTTSETKPAATTESTNTLPKFNLFSSTTPTFKFGTGTPTVPSTTATSPSSQTSSLFTKPAESVSTETKPSNFFASLNKPATTTPSSTSTTTTTTTTTSTFPNLLSGASGSTIFKPFSSNLEQTSSVSTNPTTTSTTAPTTTASSIFSSTGTTQSSSSTPFFSFSSNLGSKPSIFGQNTTPFGKSDTTSTSLFNVAAAPAGGGASAEGGENEEEEYEPPKPEASDVKEEGSVFEKRIKLYYFNEKENKFCDRGVGNLFLKPISSGESTQLIVRADTSLANILLNVKLTKVFPISKIGAKDVSYICLPNPPIANVDSKKPCKFLFKVKTEDDANELLDKLNELKK